MLFDDFLELFEYVFANDIFGLLLSIRFVFFPSLTSSLKMLFMLFVVILVDMRLL